MLAKATTFRLEPDLHEELENLSKVLKRPKNQLVNEALRDFVSRRSRALEQDLEAALASLRAYRRRDPEFKDAIAAAAKAEAQLGGHDPVEGAVAIGDLVDGQLVDAAGPVQSEIRKLLND